MNKQIITTDLDFDQIKSNLKNFLKGQEVFSDYDFEGSGLSILLDILAYNTHYNALYSNLALNESFLDSASKKESVVSLASMLGYVNRSSKCSTAIVDVLVTLTSNLDFITLPKHTQFIGSSPNNKQKFFFYNKSATLLTKGDGFYYVNDLELLEGIPNTEQFLVEPNTRYIISNKNVDLSTLSVTVKESSTSTNIETFNKADDILEVTGSDKVYFVKSIYNDQYEIYFGNDKIGKALNNGNIVYLTYFITNKSAANGCTSFSCSDDLGGSRVDVNTVKMSFGGDEPESINEIKFNAPRLLNAYNRAVTANDYEALIRNTYPNIDYINVWGGEENDPPVYGKVFICIKPKTAAKLTLNEKTFIKQDIIKFRNVLGISPEFVDPDYINLQVKSSIYFDQNKTTLSASDIVNKANTAIRLFNTQELKRFNSVFRYSKFVSLIDSVDSSILSNITVITIKRPVNIIYFSKADNVVKINNAIYNSGVPEEAVQSTGFYVQGDPTVYYLEDDGKGNLVRYKLTSDYAKIYIDTKGSVDYTNGIITIKDLPISRTVNNSFDLIIKPASNDILTSRNNVVQFDLNAITVEATPIFEQLTNYSPAPSR